MLSQHSLSFCLTAIIISSGFLIFSVKGQCSAGPGCNACNASNSADCISCNSQLGLTAGYPRHCEACTTDPSCVNCTTLSLCTSCHDKRQTPYQNGTAACGPCSSNCTNCTTSGAGNCDMCMAGFLLNNATRQCETCKVVNCSNCARSGVSTCDQCIAKNFLIVGSSQKKCAPCSDNCKGCPSNGGNFCDYSRCEDPYGLNNATKLCAPCAANCTSCPINGFGLCDPGKCSQGFTLNNTNMCAQCSMYCSTCNVTGAQHCDGAAYCSNVSTYNAGSKTCELITTTARPTTTAGPTTAAPTTAGPKTNNTVITTTARPTTTAGLTTAAPTTAGPKTNNTVVVTRSAWGAGPVASGVDKLSSPVPYISVHHTRNNCSDSSSCLKLISAIQGANKKLNETTTVQATPILDIVYNFLIDQFGYIYEGCGWEFQGKHTFGLNNQTIGVGFIGTFTTDLPSVQARDALDRLIKMGLEGQNAGKLSATYKIYPHRDLECTTCPGGKMYNYTIKMLNYGGTKGYPYKPCQSYSNAIRPQK